MAPAKIPKATAIANTPMNRLRSAFWLADFRVFLPD